MRLRSKTTILCLAMVSFMGFFALPSEAARIPVRPAGVPLPMFAQWTVPDSKCITKVQGTGYTCKCVTGAWTCFLALEGGIYACSDTNPDSGDCVGQP